MKKIASLLTTALIAFMPFTLTSCNDDEAIADTLWGVWEGDMYAYYDYQGYTYSAASSVLAFDHDPYSYASGSGYWIDYYSNAPWDYFATRITWTVVNNEIRIYSIEENKYYYISDYSLSNGSFHGYIDDEYGSAPIEFHLYKTAAPTWSDYDWNGWGYYDDYGYYAPAKKSQAKTRTSGEKPVRHIGKPATEQTKGAN